MAAPKAANLPKDIGEWCRKIPSEEKGKYPIDQSDGGEDDDAIPSAPAIGALNRTQWKYQDWLAGFNGGPLRGPIQRIPDRHMKTLRAGLQAAGCPVTDSPDSEYHIGRNPM